MINILFVHQSAELYGSDKMLISLVQGLDRKRFRPIVLLPYDGPLLKVLRAQAIETHIVPMVKLSRSVMHVTGLISVLLSIKRSLGVMSQVLGGTPIGAVHSNTLAVLSGALWARSRGLPHVWHVHEIVTRPRLVRPLFPWLLRLLADHVACNSVATRKFLVASQPALAAKTSTIWNGLDRSDPIDPDATEAFRRELGLAASDVLVALIGRINRFKGHDVLINAAEHLHAAGVRHVRYLVVGSAPPGQEHFLERLQCAVARSFIRDHFVVLNFQPDIWRIWDACDIAVVPSVEPEGFGMVAVEAMAAGKPVVATAHGGILDIVVDGETGILVPPGEAVALAQALGILAQNTDLRNRMGKAGAERWRRKFRVQNYVEAFEHVYGRMDEHA